MKDEFSELLRRWNPETPEPADFKRRVWRRIEASGAQTRTGWGGRLLVLLSRPRVAFALAAFAVIAGGLFGAGSATATAANAYLRSVNPYAQLR